MAEYWLVDPESDEVTIYRRAGEAFTRAAVVENEAGRTLVTPLIPGFALDVAEVFAL